ncbi:MAG: aldehyde dehydrogenase family protein, partial [Pseudomonadota bacterium]
MTDANTLRNRVIAPSVCANIINGAEDANGERLPVLDPSTGIQISELVEADANTVDAAVTAAAKAFEKRTWRQSTVEKRQEVLEKIASLIEENAERLAGLECLNTGIPYHHLLAGQIKRAALNFRFFAGYIGQSGGDLYTQNADYLTYVRRDPVGVAALLGPWNAPLALTTMKIAACIAFGNSCVVKPSEQTPLTMVAMMALLQAAGVPDGVVNLVNGAGPRTGAMLCAHPRIDRISFTGGTTTGRAIMQAAGANLTPVTMELG